MLFRSILMGTFTSLAGATRSTAIIGGNWDMNLYAIGNNTVDVKFYFDAYYVTADGVTETLIASGTPASATIVSSVFNIYTYSLYIPTTILPDLTYRIRVKVYGVFVGGSVVIIVYGVVVGGSVVITVYGVGFVVIGGSVMVNPYISATVL